MGFTRNERVLLHTKQARGKIQSGAPTVDEIKEGGSVTRVVNGVLKEYTKHNGVLYSKNLDRE